MPEALATTKRKFYKALDALTSTPTSISANSAPVHTSKRPASSAVAFDEARGRASKRLRLRTSSSSISQLAAASPIPRLHPPPNAAPSQPPPHFSPWSHDTFLARLQTYSSVSLWHPKPDLISEVRWAKRGWVCVDVNTVACRGGCEKRIVVSLTDTNLDRGIVDASRSRVDLHEGKLEEGDDGEEASDALEDALVERYQHMIIHGHSETCLWYKAGCKDDVYRVPVVRPSIWQPLLRQRFHSIIAIHASVEHIEIRKSHEDKSTDGLLNTSLPELTEHVLGRYDASPTTAQQALDIALHGWRGSTEVGTDLLCCDACFQRVGLWMYQPNYHQPRHSLDADEESELGVRSVDLLETHREYCPWRNAETQKATESLHGLNASQILQRVAMNSVRDHRRRTRERPGAGTDDTGLAPPELPIDTGPVLSREEIAQQDKERESRLRKLKNLFSLKRRVAPLAAKGHV